jgi:hypothetical protein
MQGHVIWLPGLPFCLILSLDIRDPFVPHVTGIADFYYVRAICLVVASLLIYLKLAEEPSKNYQIKD